MARFVYRMQNILEIKRKLEDQAKMEYGLARARLNEEEEKLEQLRLRKAGYEEQSRQLLKEKLKLREVREAKEATLRMDEFIERQKEEIRKAEQALEEERIKLQKAIQERKIHEKLRENAYEEYLLEEKAAENREIDELTSYIYGQKWHMADKTEEQVAGNAADADERKRLKEERKKLKQEQKEQRKEARKRAKELADQEEQIEDGPGGSGPVLLVTLIIVVVWLAILALLIKLDVGGFGSGVLRPVLQNVPVINKILPSEKMANPGSNEDEYYGYTDLKDAVEQIKRLELELENVQAARQQEKEGVDALRAEIERLKTFENNQIAFEKIKNEFYNEVIYSDKGPGADEYIKYYESMDPATAAQLYQQTIQKEQTDSQVKDYAAAYAAMKPKEAAAIFEAMQDDLDLAARILNEMSSDDRGKILGVMDSEVAARLTKIMEPNS